MKKALIGAAFSVAAIAGAAIPAVNASAMEQIQFDPTRFSTLNAPVPATNGMASGQIGITLSDSVSNYEAYIAEIFSDYDAPFSHMFKYFEAIPATTDPAYPLVVDPFHAANQMCEYLRVNTDMTTRSSCYNGSNTGLFSIVVIGRDADNNVVAQSLPIIFQRSSSSEATITISNNLSSSDISITVDSNGGQYIHSDGLTPIDNTISPASSSIVYFAPTATEMQVIAGPNNNTYDATEVDGLRIEGGLPFYLNNGSIIKYLWKDAAATTATDPVDNTQNPNTLDIAPIITSILIGSGLASGYLIYRKVSR